MQQVALTRQSEQAQQRILDQIRALAVALGKPDLLETLESLKRNRRQPAVHMLRERQALADLLDTLVPEIQQRLSCPPVQDSSEPDPAPDEHASEPGEPGDDDAPARSRPRRTTKTA